MKTKQERIIEKQAELINWYKRNCEVKSLIEPDKYINYRKLQSELASIEAEPEEEIYPKEFVEWLHYRCFIQMDYETLIEVHEFTLHDLFEYWKTRKSS